MGNYKLNDITDTMNRPIKTVVVDFYDKQKPMNENIKIISSGFEILDLEIDRDCTGVICDKKPSHIPLYKYNEVPDYLKGNPYVVTGYRAALPFSVCWKSLFIWSNESVNIWSHLIGFILFMFMTIYDNVILIPEHNGGLADHFILTLGLCCFQFCMLCSAGYHLFACHSERAGKRWLNVDLAGISVGLIGCYLPGVHYAFYCLSIWRDIYMIIISILSFGVLYLQLHPRFFSRGWWHHRLLLYCCLVGYGVIPSCHWVYLSGGVQDEVVQLFLPKVAVMYCLGIAAFVFYLTKFPERCCPGKVDYIGSSHQCWHIIVVVAFWWWHDAGQEILQYRARQQCL